MKALRPVTVVLLALTLLLPGCRDDPGEPAADATVGPDVELDVYLAPRERYAFAFPADWDRHATETRFSAGPAEGEMPRLLAMRLEYEETTVDAVVERMRGEVPAEPTVTEVEVPGARAARRLSWQTGEGLGNETVVAQHAEGFYVVLMLAWDTDDPPPAALIETIVNSLELAGDATPRPEA